MRRLFLGIIFLLISFTTFGQSIGSTVTPYDTAGWDMPQEYTNFYGFPIYRLLSNPGGWINRSQTEMDSLFNALIVYTDSLQLYIVNDTLRIADELSGHSSFTGTEVVDTIRIIGIDSLDVVVASPRETGYNVNDILFIKVIVDTVLVKRNATGGTSGLKYNWIWIKKYQ